MKIKGNIPQLTITHSKGIINFVTRADGTVYARKWPRRRRGVLPQITQDQVKVWDTVQAIVRWAEGEEYSLAAAQTGGTAFYTRDLLIMAAYGHLTSWPGYGWRYKDLQTIQSLLDSISDEEGVILYRGPDAWVALAPGPDGYTLTMLSGLPAWQPGSSGPGSITVTDGTTTVSNVTKLLFGSETVYDLGAGEVQIGGTPPVEDFMQVTMTLSSADLLALSVTPIEVLPTPGPGKALVVVQSLYISTFGTTPYTGGTDAGLYFGDPANGQLADGGTGTGLTQSSNYSIWGGSLYPGEGDYAGSPENLAINVGAPTSALVGGDGSVDLVVVYVTVNT